MHTLGKIKDDHGSYFFWMKRVVIFFLINELYSTHSNKWYYLQRILQIETRLRYTIYRRDGYLHLHYQRENFHYFHDIYWTQMHKKNLKIFNCTYVHKFVFLYLQLLNLIPY